MAGVALGKQLVIWPMGFGLMELAARAPWVFETLKSIIKLVLKDLKNR